MEQQVVETETLRACRFNKEKKDKLTLEIAWGTNLTNGITWINDQV